MSHPKDTVVMYHNEDTLPRAHKWHTTGTETTLICPAFLTTRPQQPMPKMNLLAKLQAWQ